MRDALRAAFARRGDPHAVVRLHRALLGEVASPLVPSVPGDVTAPPAGRGQVAERALVPELVEALRHEPFGLSAGMLAARIRRGKVRVLAALHGDPRFVMTGRGRGVRWRVVETEPLGTGAEAARGDATGIPSPGTSFRVAAPHTAAESLRPVGADGWSPVESEGVLGSAPSGATAATTASGTAR